MQKMFQVGLVKTVDRTRPFRGKGFFLCGRNDKNKQNREISTFYFEMTECVSSLSSKQPNNENDAIVCDRSPTWCWGSHRRPFFHLLNGVWLFADDTLFDIIFFC